MREVDGRATRAGGDRDPGGLPSRRAGSRAPPGRGPRLVGIRRTLVPVRSGRSGRDCRSTKHKSRLPPQASVQPVILDANALLMPFQFRINLEAERRRLLGDHEILVPSPVIEELRGLARSVPEARPALRLAQRFRILEAPGGADDAI